MSDSTNMEQKIINAAIDCIETYGIQGTTIRRIAQTASANSAAVNYYFRTKDQLMEKVIQTTLNHAFNWDHFIFPEGSSPRERLTVVLVHLTEGALAFPEITRAHIMAPQLEGHSPRLAYDRFSAFTDELYADLVAHGAQPGEALRFGLMQAITSSIVGIGLFLDLFSPQIKEGLPEKDAIHRYINTLVQSVI